MQWFVVPGRPVPEAWEAVKLLNGPLVGYKARKTKEFERVVRANALHAGISCRQGEVATVMVFETSWEPEREADIDNLEKSVHDALKGVAYEDDRQVRANFKAIRPCQPGRDRTLVLILSLDQFGDVFGYGLERLLSEFDKGA